jgi:hypothetical protein
MLVRTGAVHAMAEAAPMRLSILRRETVFRSSAVGWSLIAPPPCRSTGNSLPGQGRKTTVIQRSLSTHGLVPLEDPARPGHRAVRHPEPLEVPAPAAPSA